MSAFKYYVGIDYSGAKAPVSRLAQLQVYESKVNSVPKELDLMTKVQRTGAVRRWQSMSVSY